MTDLRRWLSEVPDIGDFDFAPCSHGHDLDPEAARDRIRVRLDGMRERMLADGGPHQPRSEWSPAEKLCMANTEEEAEEVLLIPV